MSDFYRLGNHVCPKDNKQVIIARFDQQGREVIRNDLDALLTQSRSPVISSSRGSPINSSPPDSVNSSRASTPQHATFPHPISQPSMFRNAPLFTPPRILSPQAPVFQMTTSAPINVPTNVHRFENSLDMSEESSFGDENNSQPERSDTPHSMHSTTSNESTDSGYCGYVESYPCKIRLFIRNNLIIDFLSRLLQIESFVQSFSFTKKPKSWTSYEQRFSSAPCSTSYVLSSPTSHSS